MPPPRAILLDFNGTLSDDEPMLERVFRELFAEHLELELTTETYYAELAGFSDPEIVARGLALAGHPADHPVAGELVQRKIDRYCELVVTESPVTPEAAAFVHAAAELVPLAVVSGASRPEIEQVLEAAGLRGHFEAVVTAEDVGERSKPHPEGYLQGLAALAGVAAAEAVAFEDSLQGAAAARAAGLRVVAVRGTADEAALAELVERVVDGLEPGLVAELFGTPPRG